MTRCSRPRPNMVVSFDFPTFSFAFRISVFEFWGVLILRVVQISAFHLGSFDSITSKGQSNSGQKLLFSTLVWFMQALLIWIGHEF